MNRRALPALVVVAVLAVVGLVRAGDQFDESPIPGSETDIEIDSGRRSAAGGGANSGLSTTDLDQLPIEAADTVALVLSGGPYPYERDGIIFQNREGLLPERPVGYYREFTVITPGEDDRGARRIVAGLEGELYYTDDHYSSFVVVDHANAGP